MSETTDHPTPKEQHMPETLSLPAEAVVGRRVAFTYHRDLQKVSRDQRGVITGIDTEQPRNVLKIRLDGSRNNLRVQPDYEGLWYLDEVGPVPELPMGRFIPSTKDVGFDYEYDGVIVVQFEDDDLAVLTADREKAVAAAATYLREVFGLEDESEIRDEVASLKARWVAFEWEPEDAECAWFMHSASEGDEAAIQVHYLPVL
ncbi:hypothetical protein [Streptomyces sp. NPDC096153]|uniref:hypothetical protein n=1 Tax=Streptomyces sp. NPDC096153 TaxID=3155548 RepID=UPI003328629A